MTIKGTNAGKTAENIYDEIGNLEYIFSPTIEGSDLYKINHSAVGEKVVVSNKTNDLIKTALYVFEVSDGAYDPSVYPLVRLWQFSGDTFVDGMSKQPPTDEEI
ncbi:MAG: FAD:protein FMN transferase, partial [Clostridia bacterium]|nr:FAD:protein FMN transferase [Clostridia bacterium]